MNKRKCVVCGARVRNMNPKTVTCDSICTRAKKNGVTRERQTILDIDADESEKQLRERINRTH